MAEKSHYSYWSPQAFSINKGSSKQPSFFGGRSNAPGIGSRPVAEPVDMAEAPESAHHRQLKLRRLAVLARSATVSPRFRWGTILYLPAR